MKNIEKAIELLEGTSISETLSSLKTFYEKSQGEIDSFTTHTCIGCPSGCGSCCERFMPDITEAEAMMVAAEILMRDNPMYLKRRLENAKGRTVGPCPLYDFDNDHHCMVYEARPLICRLFANSCFPDKNGRATFRSCHLNPDFRGLEDGALEEYEGKIPVMGEYGIQLRSLDGNSEDTEMMPEAVLKAAAMIEYYLSMMYPAPQCS